MNEHKETALKRYLLPTPAGAFYAIKSCSDDPISRYLRFLLSHAQTPLFVEGELRNQLSPDPVIAESALSQIQSESLLKTLKSPILMPERALEELLPRLLHKLAVGGKAILSDEQGLYLARSGFTHAVAEELSALSANLLATTQRYESLLHNNLGVQSAAWAVVDPTGNSEISFWPLYFPRDRFTLILFGEPRLDVIEFTLLVSCLALRYND